MRLRVMMTVAIKICKCDYDMSNISVAFMAQRFINFITGGSKNGY